MLPKYICSESPNLVAVMGAVGLTAAQGLLQSLLKGCYLLQIVDSYCCYCLGLVLKVGAAASNCYTKEHNRGCFYCDQKSGKNSAELDDSLADLNPHSKEVKTEVVHSSEGLLWFHRFHN